MKASVYIAVSIDGFIARSDGDIEWLQSSGEEDGGNDYGYEAFMASVEALVMGRNTFEKVLTFGDWPYKNKRVVVLSSGTVAIPKNLSNCVEASSLSPSELLASLSNLGVDHVYVDGGITIQSFLRESLINSLVITRIPRLIGEGIALFGALEKDIHLRHIRTEAYSNGFVQSEYEIIQSAA